MDARASRRIKRMSKQQEKRAAADLGGRTMAASGGTELGGGGDVRRMGHTRVECKMTEATYYVLKKAELEKIRREAAKGLEIPVMQIGFRDGLGKLDRYAAVRHDPATREKPPYHYPGYVKPLSLEYTTYKNSVRIHQDVLQRYLLVDKIPFYVTFKDGMASRHWEIMTWEKFLETHEEI